MQSIVTLNIITHRCCVWWIRSRWWETHGITFRGKFRTRQSTDLKHHLFACSKILRQPQNLFWSWRKADADVACTVSGRVRFGHAEWTITMQCEPLFWWGWIVIFTRSVSSWKESLLWINFVARSIERATRFVEFRAWDLTVSVEMKQSLPTDWKSFLWRCFFVLSACLGPITLLRQNAPPYCCSLHAARRPTCALIHPAWWSNGDLTIY